jgi:ADP-ribosyl-[dinitrogen reductase] hydrolase
MRERARLDRALGAYLGLALGDALGAPVEFMTAREIAHRYGTLRTMIGGGWLKLAPGEVTDDTTMALALGDAIVGQGGFELEAVAGAFVRWLRAKPIDCGNTCRRGIRRYMNDGSFVGPPSEGDAGNGAAMRNLPVVLSTLGDEAAFAAQTLAQCRFTHHHRLSDAASLAFGRMTRTLIDGGDTAACRPLADALVAMHPEFRFDPYPRRASGYIVDTVQTVLHHFFAHDRFDACVVAVVNRGEDADTNGALAGMLAGARCGARALPQEWLARLDRTARGRIEVQTAALVALAAAATADRR